MPKEFEAMDSDMIITGINEADPVFFLHGFGSSATAFQKEWKYVGREGNSYFINGTEWDQFSNGYRWFPFTSKEEKLSKYIMNAAMMVEKEILKLETNFISIAGHSQGAMIALELLLRNKIKIKNLWSFCGFLPASLLRPLSLYTTTNVYFFYSVADKYISKESFENTCRFFTDARNINITVNVSQKLDHTFSREWLLHKNYLKNH